MPSVGHLIVGVSAGRLSRAPRVEAPWAWMAGLVALSHAADLDVLAFRFGIPYGAAFGHRGAAHSIVVATALGLAWGLVGVRLGVRPRVALITALLVAISHGVLDAFTDGGKGIALFWPFSSERVFAPWRPIPVAPIGMGILSRRGVAVMLQEVALFSPLLLLAFWPSRRERRRGRAEAVPNGGR